MPAAGGAGPQFIAPMLATLAKELPVDLDAWTAEFKWDGMRACVAVHRGQVRAWSRTGHDITSRHPELTSIGALPVPSLVLDGEIVALNNGRPDFGLLQRRMHIIRPGRELLAAVPVTFIAFDLLQVGTKLLTGNPFRQRRVLLGSMGLDAAGVIVSPLFGGNEAPDVLAVSAERGYEGVVLKRPASRYLPGRRSPDWIKVKITRTIDVVIGGWLPGAGYRSRDAGSVMAGIPGLGGLRYIGDVGSGFSAAELADLTAVLTGLEQPDPPFTGPLPAHVTRRARWTRPVLTAEVAYAELTATGRLRHPVWRGLRAGLAPGTSLRLCMLVGDFSRNLAGAFSLEAGSCCRPSGSGRRQPIADARRHQATRSRNVVSAWILTLDIRSDRQRPRTQADPAVGNQRPRRLVQPQSSGREI